MKTNIPIRNINMLSVLLAIAASCMSMLAYAEDYPTFYEDTTPTSAPDDVDFNNAPPVCAEDDEVCIANYLGTLGEYLDGSMTAQQPPSPAYTWDATKCTLNSVAECDALETQWRAWVARAESGSLDFAQGAEQSDTLECKDVYDYWGMRYVYHCQ